MSDENKYEFTGTLDETPEFQVVPTGQMKTTLKVSHTKRWDGGSKVIQAPFELFGKGADYAEKKNLKAGMTIRVSFELDSFKGYPKLKAWKVEVIAGTVNRGGDDDLPPR